MMSEILSYIRTLAASSEDRVTKVRRLAQIIRHHGEYRWVGVYDVGAAEVAIIAWSGPGAPAYPTFSSFDLSLVFLLVGRGPTKGTGLPSALFLRRKKRELRAILGDAAI
jgi:hypothetical protein